MLYGIVDVHFFSFFFLFFLFSFFFFLFSFFFPPRFCPAHISGTVTRRLQIECAAWSCGLVVHCCLPSNSLCYFFFYLFFFFFSAKILSELYLWNRYSQRLQIECAAWSCGLVVHCCLPSNSLYFLFFIFFPPRFSPGHISGTITRRDS